jgi:hypothetical protein
MTINEILGKQGWELVQRLSWVAVKDPRPEFRAAFNTDRVGKIVDASFYVTLPPLAEVTKELARQIGRDAASIKTTNGARDVMYWGFDTAGVSEESMASLTSKLANAIDEML